MNGTTQQSQLFGLILAGGRSTRMGTDKAALEVAGRPQLLRLAGLLKPYCTRCHASLRPGQKLPFALPEDLPVLLDAQGDSGPAGAVLTALEAAPEAAWLVVACDFPQIDDEAIRALVAARNVHVPATAYAGADGAPEPLCAVYERGFLPHLKAAVEARALSLRRLLSSLNVPLLAPASPAALTDADTPEAWSLATRLMKTVRITYYALLREQRGQSHETIQTAATTLRELYEGLRKQHRFSLPVESLKVAVNDAFSSWDAAIGDNDDIVFLPPVSGG